jgi:hypothetical protein
MSGGGTNHGEESIDAGLRSDRGSRTHRPVVPKNLDRPERLPLSPALTGPDKLALRTQVVRNPGTPMPAALIATLNNCAANR